MKCHVSSYNGRVLRLQRCYPRVAWGEVQVKISSFSGVESTLFETHVTSCEWISLLPKDGVSNYLRKILPDEFVFDSWHGDLLVDRFFIIWLPLPRKCLDGSETHSSSLVLWPHRERGCTVRRGEGGKYILSTLLQDIDFNWTSVCANDICSGVEIRGAYIFKSKNSAPRLVSLRRKKPCFFQVLRSGRRTCSCNIGIFTTQNDPHLLQWFSICEYRVNLITNTKWVACYCDTRCVTLRNPSSPVLETWNSHQVPGTYYVLWDMALLSCINVCLSRFAEYVCRILFVFLSHFK